MQIKNEKKRREALFSIKIAVINELVLPEY